MFESEMEVVFTYIQYSFSHTIFHYIEEGLNSSFSSVFYMARITITTTIDSLLYSQAQDQIIPWSDALEFGMQIILADRNLGDYPDCKLLKKMNFFKNLSEELSSENLTLKEKKG